MMEVCLWTANDHTHVQGSPRRGQLILTFEIFVPVVDLA
jgi:hypothetical protein